MHTDDKLLTLVQWMSPGFPTGGFAYSHGIETAFRDGLIDDAAGLEDWLDGCLRHGAGWSDAIWLRLAHCARDPLETDAQARAFTIGAERLWEAERQGAAFVTTVNAVWDLHMPKMLMPVAVGHAAGRMALEADTTTLLYLQAFAANLISAALRLYPIGQTRGQEVLRNLHPTCLHVARDSLGATPDDVSGEAFLSEIMAMRHETQQPRLFQS